MSAPWRAIAVWDGVLARDSAAAAVYSAWRSALTVQERSVVRAAAERRTLHVPASRARFRSSRERKAQTLQRGDGAGSNTQAFPYSFVTAFDLLSHPSSGPAAPGPSRPTAPATARFLDVADRQDRLIVTNVPGQSAQPESLFYRNLLPLRTDDTYFPLGLDRVATPACRSRGGAYVEAQSRLPDRRVVTRPALRASVGQAGRIPASAYVAGSGCEARGRMTWTQRGSGCEPRGRIRSEPKAWGWAASATPRACDI